jgi:hypothetical protein
MADLGAARRALMVDLDPALNGVLPAAAPQRSVYRDYAARVRPGSFPVTAEIVSSLAADYDLAGASVRSLAVRPAEADLRVHLTLAAPRRFVPSTGRVAPDGSRKPWPAAPLHFTFVGVVDLRFDAEDRVGVTVSCADAGPTVAIGRGGRLRATCASVWSNDPRWYESAAGRAADAVTPRGHRVRREPVRTLSLTEERRAAAGALVDLMVRVRLVDYHPELAAGIPVREISRVAAGAGAAILAAGAKRGPARRRAFAELVQRWRGVPTDVAPAPIPSGPATLRYASYDEPHELHDVHREGSAVLVAAVPDAEVQHIHRDAGTLTIGESLAVQPQ